LKYFLPIISLFLGFIFLNSCEKIIEFDLSESREVVVIEANITSNRGPFKVLVSKTSPYFGTKSNNLVSGAKVYVKAEKGNSKFFTETSPGIYKLDRIIAMPGFWYVVDVEYDGVHYTARSFLNDIVPIMDLSVSYFDGFGFFESGYKVNCFIRDPADKDNYYRIKYFVNGNPVDNTGEISLYTDKLFNGKVVGLGQRTLVFSENDTLTVELQTIDKATYQYFSTLESISGDVFEQSASPANPISNFSNGALGYFSAYSFDRKTLILKDILKK